MNRKLLCTGLGLFLVFAALQIAACGKTAPARYYTLTALAGPEKAEIISFDKSRQIVGIGPIALAKYLDHPSITTRSGANTLSRSELDRWGGSLNDEVSRVLVENMRLLLPGGRYLIIPWLETSATDYRVQLNITRFEGTSEGFVVLNAAWLLFETKRSAPLASGEAVLAEPVHGGGYDAISDAMSRALAEVSRQIAAKIPAGANSSGE